MDQRKLPCSPHTKVEIELERLEAFTLGRLIEQRSELLAKVARLEKENEALRDLLEASA